MTSLSSFVLNVRYIMVQVSSLRILDLSDQYGRGMKDGVLWQLLSLSELGIYRTRASRDNLTRR